jgi:hypothetical protein
MAASTNFMIFVPTAVDTLIQQSVNSATAPANNAANLGLWAAVASNPQITRTASGSVGTGTGAGATVNTVGGAIYQGDMGQLQALWDFLSGLYRNR